MCQIRQRLPRFTYQTSKRFPPRKLKYYDYSCMKEVHTVVSNNDENVTKSHSSGMQNAISIWVSYILSFLYSPGKYNCVISLLPLTTTQILPQVYVDNMYLSLENGEQRNVARKLQVLIKSGLRKYIMCNSGQKVSPLSYKQNIFRNILNIFNCNSQVYF